MPHSGIPVPHSQIAEHYQEAADLMGVGGTFTDREIPITDGQEIDPSQVMMIGATPNIAELHETELSNNDLIRICLNSRVSSLELEAGKGSIKSLNVFSRGTEHKVVPGNVVICCGGIQSARLLLMIQRDNPSFLGGGDGPLGRYYCGHVSGAIARICFDQPEQARRYVIRKEDDGWYSRGCFQITAAAQRNHKLLNSYFTCNNLPLGDPGYKNGAFSAIHMALSARHGTTRYLSRYHPGHIKSNFEFSLQPGSHLRNIMANPFQTFRGIAEIVRTRSKEKKNQPFFSFFNPSGVYALKYHSEQVPNPCSRVTLSDAVDGCGVPLPHVDMRLSDTDVESILKSHQVLDSWMQDTGHGHIEWHQPQELCAQYARSLASDGYHQIGLTRMSEAPREGVVDKDLRVHGVTNMFVISTGVLPTGGRAHPTFPTVALGVRLATQMATAVHTSGTVR